MWSSESGSASAVPSSTRRAVKASETYLRNTRPSTTCLYSDASRLPRSLSAASQSVASSDLAGLLLALRAPATSLLSVALRGLRTYRPEAEAGPSAPRWRLIRAAPRRTLRRYRLWADGRCSGPGAVTLGGADRRSTTGATEGGCACRPAATARCSAAARAAAA